MSKKIILSLLFVALLVVLLTPGAFAATLTVGSGQAYATIQDAVNAASPGDTIIVNSGTYPESVNIYKAVDLIGQDTGSGLPVVDGSGVSIITLYLLTSMA